MMRQIVWILLLPMATLAACQSATTDELAGIEVPELMGKTEEQIEAKYQRPDSLFRLSEPGGRVTGWWYHTPPMHLVFSHQGTVKQVILRNPQVPFEGTALTAFGLQEHPALVVPEVSVVWKDYPGYRRISLYATEYSYSHDGSSRTPVNTEFFFEVADPASQAAE